MPVAGAIAQEDLQYPDPYSEGYFERLDYYDSLYSDEIFGFCKKHFLLKIRKMGSCLRKQQKLKDAIITNAQDKLGSRSLADSVYNECLDYHPRQGVVRVGSCVETRLMLHEKVEDDSIERVIYRKCEKKWRRNNASAIDTCCAHEGRYYRDNGKLRD